jgi:hypothetical protein
MDKSLDNFDWEYYLENNQDLFINGINSKETCINHWLNYGKNENREYKFINNLDKINLKGYIEKIKKMENNNCINKEDAWNLILIIYDKIYNNLEIDNIKYFDWKYYIKNNIDLLDNNIFSKEDIINHWINFGKNENRKYLFNYSIIDDIDNSINKYINNNIEDFDWEYYISNNQDLLKNKICTKDSAIKHWINYGSNENRNFRFYKKNIVNLNNIEEINEEDIKNIEEINEEDINNIEEINKEDINNIEEINEEEINKEDINNIEEINKEDINNIEEINEEDIKNIEEINEEDIKNIEEINEEDIKNIYINKY